MTTPRMRRGFTLIEILIALVLAAIFGTAVLRVMTSSSRMTGTQYARIDAQTSARAAASYVSVVLRELDASEGDVSVANASTLQYRGMKWSALTCSALTVSGGDLQVTIKNSQTFGQRAPDNTLDSLIVFNENDPNSRTDDQWLIGWASGASSAQNCADGAAGTRLTFRITAASGGNSALQAGFTQGSPIRGFQQEELSLASSAGSYYLGRRTMNQAGTWGSIELLAGPLTNTGLSFAYRDTLNATTATLANIATVSVTIRSRSLDVAQTASGITNIKDSLITRVGLRNNKRF